MGTCKIDVKKSMVNFCWREFPPLLVHCLGSDVFFPKEPLELQAKETPQKMMVKCVHEKNLQLDLCFFLVFACTCFFRIF